MADVHEADDARRALRILLDDVMMRSIARRRRFRVLASAPVGGRRYGIDLVDYASDRAVTAEVDLDRGGVASLRCTAGASTLAPAEQDEALEVALADRRVAASLALDDRPTSVVHVGGAHRSAAVTFGAPRSPASLVAVVDLARRAVTKILPGEA